MLQPRLGAHAGWILDLEVPLQADVSWMLLKALGWMPCGWMQRKAPLQAAVVQRASAVQEQ